MSTKNLASYRSQPSIFNQIRKLPTTNNPNILIFLTALLKTSYEYRESRIEHFFRINRAPPSNSDRPLRVETSA